MNTVNERIIEVDLDGRTATWSPASGFTGHPDLVEAATEAVLGSYAVEWGRVGIQVSEDSSWVGALTALMYLHPGRTRITKWPDELRQWWEENQADCGHSVAFITEPPVSGS